MVLLYKIISIIFSPFIHIFLLYRAYNGKEDISRITEKLGFPSQDRPNGDLIWIHAASVGEGPHQV